MSQERWFRGGDEVAAFDWQRTARELDVPLDVARALYMRAMRLIGPDAWHAEQLYRRWLRTMGDTKPTESPRVPGRRTRVMHEADELRELPLPALGLLDPGRWTRVLLEIDAHNAGAESSRRSEHSDGAGMPRTLPAYNDVQRAMAALGITAKHTETGGPDAAPEVPSLPTPQLVEITTAMAAAKQPDALESATRADVETQGPRGPGRREAIPEVGAVVAGGNAAADALRAQLVASVTRGRGAADALAAAEPGTATAVLRELASVDVPGHSVPVLRLVAQADDGQAVRLLGRDSAGTRLPDDLAVRLSPHVGGEAARGARLHTDDAADVVATAHHAHAVTLGEQIYFARGAYAPGTERGDELLAHELTHVAQGQRGALHRAAAKGIESGGALDPAEAEAELRGKLAGIQLHPATTTPPQLAAPSGQPTTDGARQAKIAAQQQRLALSNQPGLPEAAAPVPPASAPDPAVSHQPPPMTTAPAPASTGNAYVDAFNAPPSKQATELWAQTGVQATTKVAADQARFDATLQALPIKLDGADPKGAKGSGGGKPVATGAPAKGATPPAAKPTPTPRPPPATAGAAARTIKPDANATQIKADAQKVLDALPAKAPDVKTDPGPAPVTDLAGQADPMRTVADQQHGTAEGAKALDAEKAKVLAGPGAAQVQPAKLDEKLKVPKEESTGPMPALPVVPGMDKFKKLNLPANAQVAFDDIAKPKMDASLAQAKAKMTQVEVQRDADRTKAVNDAHDKVKQAHADADKQQQLKVSSARTQIANHQADTLVKQENEVKKLDKQSGEKKTAAIAKVNTRIQADQAKVDADYQGAEKKAQDEKRKGDEEAARKKKEAEDKKQDESWWDRATDAICDGIKAIADAIDKALDAVCKLVGDILDAVKDAACKLIDAARDFVCKALDEFGDWLKSAVTALLGSVFPELAAALNRLIDAAVNVAKAAVNAVADGLKKAVTALCDGLKGAIDAVIAAFKAAVQAAATFAQALVTGDWSLVGKMILEGILKALGIDPAAFYALIAKAADSIDKIIENPGAFVGHLIDAVKLGFQQFGANFWTHLKDGVVQWLFGAFAQAGIQMPAKFDVAGVFSLVAQVLGLTWTRLRPKVVKVIGEKNTERLEFVSQYVEALMTGGFAGLWEKIKQDMSSLWDMVIGGVKDFLMEKVVQQAILKIATMWNPAGAIFQLIQTAWNVYQWVRENAQRIFGLVQAVVDSVANIVAGNIGGAANFIEASLAKLVPIAISLLADLLGLGGIADKIKGIIESIQDTVDKAIDKLIDRVMAMFKGKGGKDDKAEGDEVEVPKALAVPNPVHLRKLAPRLAEEAAQAKGDRVIYEGGAGDPKQVTKNILASHSDAHLDKKTGLLTLSAINSAPLQSAASLAELGSMLGQQLGVSKVHLVERGDDLKLEVEINPRGAGGDIDEEPPLNTGRWAKGSYASAEESLRDHFRRHGAEVGATTVEQYLNKAQGFASNLKRAQRAPVAGATAGVVRYAKSGKYIDLDPDGGIISFGTR